MSYSYSDVQNDITKTGVKFTSGPQTFIIIIVSTFDEVLQDQPEVSGMLDIRDDDLADVSATIPITISSLSAPQYNPRTGILTLFPGDSLKLRCSWGYRMDDNKWIFEKAGVALDTPGKGATFRTHLPVNLSASARVKLFKGVNTFASEKIHFQLLLHGTLTLPG